MIIEETGRPLRNLSFGWSHICINLDIPSLILSFSVNGGNIVKRKIPQQINGNFNKFNLILGKIDGDGPKSFWV